MIVASDIVLLVNMWNQWRQSVPPRLTCVHGSALVCIQPIRVVHSNDASHWLGAYLYWSPFVQLKTITIHFRDTIDQFNIIWICMIFANIIGKPQITKVMYYTKILLPTFWGHDSAINMSYITSSSPSCVSYIAKYRIREDWYSIIYAKLHANKMSCFNRISFEVFALYEYQHKVYNMNIVSIVDTIIFQSRKYTITNCWDNTVNRWDTTVNIVHRWIPFTKGQWHGAFMLLPFQL